jgi:hypothetical protein
MGRVITDDETRMLSEKMKRNFSLGKTDETLRELCERYVQENKHVKDAPLIKYIAACLIVHHTSDLDLHFAARLLGVEVTV